MLAYEVNVNILGNRRIRRRVISWGISHNTHDKYQLSQYSKLHEQRQIIQHFL